MLGPEDYHTIRQQIKRSENRLLFFDYDGTLMPIVKFPSLSIPNEDLIRILSALTSDKKNNVVIISGRDSVTLGKWLGSLNLTIVAEHGALIKYPGERWKELAEVTNDWKKDIISVMEQIAAKCEGSFIEEKRFSIAWHYRNAAYEAGNFHSRELIRSLTKLINGTPLQILDGNKIIEVRFNNINKGAIAKKIINEVNPDFILALGDDKTDEDMFHVLGKESVTIKIGAGDTAAGYSLSAQEEVSRFLKNIFLTDSNKI